MAFRNIEYGDGAIAEIYLGVLTGTHSSGKSTTLRAFNDEGFANYYGISVSDPGNTLPEYSGSPLEGTQIPVITSEEAMTAYARIHNIPDLATTGYSLQRQIAVEGLAQSSIIESLEKAMRVAKILQPKERVRKGIILADRSGLDGYPYSSLRTDEDQESIDLRKVDLATIGFDSNPGAESRAWPVREWVRGMMRNYCDVAFIADHTEVEIEDDGFRQTDADFRNQIALSIRDYHIAVLGNRVKRLQGTEEERIAAVTDTFKNLVSE